MYVVSEGFVESENTSYVFGPNTKLKINGEFVNYKRYENDTSDGSDGTMWVITDLTMTPKANDTSSDSSDTNSDSKDTSSNNSGTSTNSNSNTNSKTLPRTTQEAQTLTQAIMLAAYYLHSL